MKKIASLLAVFAVGYSMQAAPAAPASADSSASSGASTASTSTGTASTTASAADASAVPFAPAPAYTLTTNFTYANEYIFRGQKESNSTFQASIELGWQGLYGGIWTNQPLHNENNEVDYYIGYGIPLANYWKIDTGLTAYTYPEGDAVRYHALSSGFSTYESYVGLTGGSLFTGTPYALMPSVYAYYDWKLDNYVLQTSLGYSLPIRWIGTSLDFSATAGYTPNTGRFYSGIGNSAYWGLGVTLPYHLSPNATLTAGIQYAGNSESVTNYGQAYKFAYTIGLTLGF